MEAQTDEVSPWWLVLRAALGIGVGVALGYGAAILAFVGLVVFTGCFWACNQPDPEPILGTLLVAGAVVAAGVAATSLAAGFFGYRSWLKWVFTWTSAVVLVLLLTGLAFG